MPFFEAVRLAWHTIRVQKLKSFFSALGVMIGVTFLIAVISVVEGMNVYVVSTVTGSFGGVNTFTIQRTGDFAFGGVSGDVWREWSRRPQVTLTEAELLRKRMQTPVRISLTRSSGGSIGWQGKTATGVEITLSDAEYFRIKQWDISDGRAFSQAEVDHGAAVAVIGQDIATQLLDGRDPLKQNLTIGGIPYRVIGVVASKGSFLGMSQDKFAILPLTAPAARESYRPSDIGGITIQTTNPADMSAAMEEAEALMRIQRGLRPGQDDNFGIQTAEGALSFWKQISSALFLALPLLVSISLVVGGIVIMNIMLMAVAERTREIGIRKALGARRSDIMWQFVIESATLSVGGAILGIGTGLTLAFAISALTPLPAAVAPWSVVLGVALGIGVGMAAGIYPAMQASRLDPIEAMRNE